MLAGRSTEVEDFVLDNLTAREVAQLHLKGSIVVLSACHSGVTTIAAGDEPFGLTRAFLIAGARAVIAARWAVDDLSTWLLFRRFTELCRDDGVPVAAALQQAQRWVRGVSMEEVDEFCATAMEDARGLGVEVEELLRRRRAEALRFGGEGARALAISRGAELLAVASAANRSAAEPSLLESDDHPFADRLFWAPFEVIGDWAARYPPAAARGD
jgi:CHAT domain-containing protein